MQTDKHSIFLCFWGEKIRLNPILIGFKTGDFLFYFFAGDGIENAGKKRNVRF